METGLIRDEVFTEMIQTIWCSHDEREESNS